MTIQAIIPLIVSMLSIMGTFTVAVLFLGKLKWDAQLKDQKIYKIEQDINNLGTKIEGMKSKNKEELQIVLNKVDDVEKTIIEIGVTLKYIQEAVKEIKEKFND